MKRIICLVAFTFLLVNGWKFCGEEKRVHPESEYDINHQEDIVYNAHRNEYMLVYVETTSVATTSIFTQILDNEGKTVGTRNEILTSTDNAAEKRYPKIAWNSNDSVYFLVFEMQVLGGDFNIFGVPLSEIGAPLVPNVYPLAAGLGNQGELEISFDPITSLYGIVFEIQNPGTSDIYFLMADAIGTIYPGGIVATSYRDASPFLCRDTESGNFLLVWQYEYQNQTSIGSVITSWDQYGNLMYGSGISIITVEDGSGNSLTLNHPRCEYDSTNDFFFVVFEAVDDKGLGIYGTPVDKTAEPIGTPQFLGTDKPEDRSPEILYSPENSRFFLAFEVGDSDVSNVLVRVMEVKSDGTVKKNFEHYASEEKFDEGQEYLPQIAYNSEEQTFLVMWTHGKSNPVESVSKSGVKREVDERGSLIGRFVCARDILSTVDKVVIGILVPALAIIFALIGVIIYLTVGKKYLEKKGFGGQKAVQLPD